MPDATIMLSAGGTGGHLFPAEALAGELLKRGRRVVIVTDKRGHAFKSLGDHVPIHTVRAATLKSGIISKLKAVADMGIGILQAGRLVFKYRPGVIVGFGGYPSFPAVFAGQALGVPTVLHEQNAILGKANAVLAPRAAAIAISLEGTRGLSPRCESKAVVTGNPVRAAIVAVRDIPYAAPQQDIHLLVTGGSQGASVFGVAVPAAVAMLPEDLKQRLRIAHQCREADIPIAAAVYRKAAVDAEMMPFFSDMDKRLAACHLFIGRSGASTVAEIAVAGRPAVFVPFQHKDRQQALNAEALGGKGGAWVIEQDALTPDALAQKLRELLENPAILAGAAAAAKSCGRSDAAQRLADVVEQRILKT
jgi:UDP-N-acetylglucosamine--N-acetylmuramyl-(pentapeptide) pyrophosphoryl-undecaprenol N-acetylglucosamine transferase